MSLEFNKVFEQVQVMGRYLKHKGDTNSTRLQDALEMFYNAHDLDAVYERIDLVRKSTVSGYRGATAAPRPYGEVICASESAPPSPQYASILAADGSQIFPDAHSPAPYYLINIGLYTYHQGANRLPEQFTHPELVYNPTLLEDKDGRLVTNQTVNARRTLAEMQWLARGAWDLRTVEHVILAIHDGGLLKFFGAAEVAGSQDIENEYLNSLQKLRDTQAILAGYLDVPRSTYIISLLHLLSLDASQINDANLKNNGALEGLTDAMLLAHVLKSGERSAVMTQNSPQNKEYRDRKGADFEMAFFYMNVSPSSRPNIVRVDIPMWVAKDKEAVGMLHRLLLDQCAIQGRKHYPYVLTRADEIAYVSSIEKQQLEELIRVSMLSQEMHPEASNKLQSKGLARGNRQQHRLKV